jgi:hypothetical protein
MGSNGMAQSMKTLTWAWMISDTDKGELCSQSRHKEYSSSVKLKITSGKIKSRVETKGNLEAVTPTERQLGRGGGGPRFIIQSLGHSTVSLVPSSLTIVN